MFSHGGGHLAHIHAVDLSDIFGSNAYPKYYFWDKFFSEMIFLGPAKEFDAILKVLGIKFRNTDIIWADFHICMKCIVHRPNWLRLVLPFKVMQPYSLEVLLQPITAFLLWQI